MTARDREAPRPLSVPLGVHRRPAPALLPAAALLLGAGLAVHLPRCPPPLGAALAAAGIALGRRAGAGLACLGLGLCLGAHRGGPEPEAWLPDPDRPVQLVAVVADHWRQSSGFWSAVARVETVRQGLRVGAAPAEVRLGLYGDRPRPPLGSRLRVRGYLRPPQRYWNRLPSPAGAWRLTVESRRLLALERPGGPLARAAAWLRSQAERVLSGGGRGRGVALARALVLGDAGDLPEAWKRGLRRTGLAHLLAVSGLNVGMVGGAILLVLAWMPLIPRVALALAGVSLYLLTAGPQPSLLRASLMAFLAAVALVARRPPSSANALALVAAALVAERPALLEDLGFQLTVAATAGLVLAGPGLAARWTALPGWLGRPLAASVAAQLGVLPWSLPAFHNASPLAPLLNLAAVPWTALTLMAALLWCALGAASLEAARAVAPLLDLLAAPFGWAEEVRGTVDLALPLAASPAGALLLAAALYAVARWPRRLLPVGLALLAGLWARSLVPAASGDPELVMLDVGQGDAILLRDGRRAMLVDGGGWERGDFGGSVLLPALVGLGVRRLDAVALSHADADHCRGLVEIADYLPVAEAWAAPGAGREACDGELLGLPGIRRRVVWAGEGADLGAWSLRVLSPAAGERPAGNDGSLVLLAEARGRRVLLTGDLGAAGERRLLRREAGSLAASILKVGHHGSRTSSSPAFLAAVEPRLALISVGRRNRYHHPAGEVVERLAARRAWILRTDRDGAIRVRIGRAGRLAVAVQGRR